MKQTEEKMVVALKIQEELVKRGFIVHRYNSMSTGVIYLKVDYGLGYQVVIGAKSDLGNIRYRFNVCDDVKSVIMCRDIKGSENYFIPFGRVDLVADLVEDSVNKVKEKYGLAWYEKQLMAYEEAMKGSKLNKKFWSNSYQVIMTD